MDKLKKAKLVLVSQGKAPRLAESSLSAYVERLAELCDDRGGIKPDAPAKFERLWYEYIDTLAEQKATDAEVDEPTEIDAE